MAKKQKFGGALDEPLEPMKIGLLLGENERTKLIGERAEIEDQKLDMLLKYYELAGGDFHSLALALARDFVVGFGEKKARGRPVKWDRLATGYLYVEVRRTEEKLVGRDRAKGSLYAEVAKIPCWAGFISRVEGINRDPDPADVVRKKYLEAKSDLWSEVSWKAYSLHILQDDVAAWDDNVREHLKHLRQHKRN